MELCGCVCVKLNLIDRLHPPTQHSVKGEKECLGLKGSTHKKEDVFLCVSSVIQFFQCRETLAVGFYFVCNREEKRVSVTCPRSVFLIITLNYFLFL